VEKWQKQVEKILRKRFPDDDASDLVKAATKLVETPIDPPSGELGKVVAVIMKDASEELKPLAAVYLGFQMGVAWERFSAR